MMDADGRRPPRIHCPGARETDMTKTMTNVQKIPCHIRSSFDLLSDELVLEKVVFVGNKAVGPVQKGVVAFI